MFNQYTWELYLKAGGNEIVAKFQDMLTKHYSSQYADFIFKLHTVYSPEQSFLEEEYRQLSELVDFANNDLPNNRNNEDCEGLIDDFYGMLMMNNGNNASNAFMNFAYNIAYYSTQMTLFDPELYIPYYFRKVTIQSSKPTALGT